MKKCTIYIFLFQLFFFNAAYSQVFTDVTNSSGVVNILSFSGLSGNGASVVDYDNDGDLDFFVNTDFDNHKQLYRNQGDGTFTEVAETSGISVLYKTRSALWFDYDGDNLLDLLLLGDCYGIANCVQRVEFFLYKQNSDNTFNLVTNSGITFGNKYLALNLDRDVTVGGLASADINNDGWLDLIITIWGAQASFFLNNGDGTFSDISITSNVGETSFSRYQALFHDFNNDSFVDIIINIDFGKNEFWLNNGNNTFTEIASEIGVDSNFNEMGITIGDFDNDGDFDIYSTNITRNNNNILGHNIFLKNNWTSSNVLSFSEVANNPEFNVGISGWDWGTTFLDANNDGFLDLATTNGWEENNWTPDQSRLWLNIDGVFFSDISRNSNFSDTLNATSLLAFDMDRDGDLDLLQSMRENGAELSPVRLYKNDYFNAANANNYLVVKPRMNGNNHFAIGAVVKIIYNNGKTGMRLITAGTSFYGQEPAEAFFGLADNTIVDEIIIEWPDNTTTIVNNIAANQVITITNDTVLNIEERNINKTKVYPNPVQNIFKIESNSEIKKAEIFNILGQKLFENTYFSKTIKVDMSSISSGNYFLKITTSENDLQTLRIIKE